MRNIASPAHTPLRMTQLSVSAPRARPTIVVDMDEVLADTLGGQLSRYNREFKERLSTDDLHGWSIWEAVPATRVPDLERHLAADDFYPGLAVFPNSQIVMERLQHRYELYIATAVMEYPRSFQGKYEWIRKYFPFIQPSHIVFCGHKGILSGEYLIDDNSFQLSQFTGTKILYSSPANCRRTDFRRVNNWIEIERLFLDSFEVRPAA